MGQGYSTPGLLFGQLLRAKSFTGVYKGPTIPDTLDLTSKVFIVTGASSGLGKALTQELCARGATVHVLSRSKERLEDAKAEIMNEIKEKPGSKTCQIITHAVDLSEVTQVAAFVTQFPKEQAISCLVNNAGVLPLRRVMDSQGKLEQQVACQLVSPFVLMKGLEAQLKLGNGRVINNISGGCYTAKMDISAIKDGFKSYATGSDQTLDGALIYAIIKRSILEMGDLMTKDNGYNVPIYSTHPGWVETPGLATLFEQHPQYKAISFRELPDGIAGMLYLSVTDTLTEKDSGKFFFDGQITRKHQPLAFTECSDKDKVELNEFLHSFMV